MLLSLHIENIAVIKQVDIDFSSGFTVLTGETGAGKSIIIDSIAQLMGAKAEKELVRYGENTAMVSGLFGEFSENTVRFLLDNGVSVGEDGTLLIQRTISTDGKTKVTLNGRSIGVTLLKAIGPCLISIHGQSDTASLTDSGNHLELIDVYADSKALLEEYSALYSELESVRRELDEINEKVREGERIRDILAYQIADIDSAELHEGEEEELIDKKIKIKNSEKINKNTEFVFRALKGSEKGSVSYLLDRSITALGQISDVVPEFSDYTEKLRDCLYQIDDIAEEVYAVLSDVDESPTETLNNIESRLDKISKLKRKYGLTVKDILSFRERAGAEYEALENSEAVIKKLRTKEREIYSEALKVAERLHELRVEKSRELEERVKETLEFLDMPKVVFYTSLKERYEGEDKVLNKYGSDFAEFYISANRGAEAQPLSKIASGGELARIMLALKSVIADKDGIPTIIYDEIDAGVSGKTARKIGVKMLELSSVSQILCITHSAQIASLGDEHLFISKSDIDGATETRIDVLDRAGRINELSRILGGIDVTESQRAAAIDMLEERKIYK